jgi:truncated hemoglobin YjbI
MINAFYDRVEQDDLLSPFFPGGVHEEHRHNVATWWCEVFGGPSDYTNELGGYERMLQKHLQLDITDEQRFRFASLMSMAADDAPCPTTQSFVQPSSRISNGAPAWRWATRRRTRTSSSVLPCLDGVGVKLLHISPDSSGHAPGRRLLGGRAILAA